MCVCVCVYIYVCIYIYIYILILLSPPQVPEVIPLRAFISTAGPARVPLRPVPVLAKARPLLPDASLNKATVGGVKKRSHRAAADSAMDGFDLEYVSSD